MNNNYQTIEIYGFLYVQISQTSDAVSTYGRAKETAYQLGRALKEIKRDLEFAYVGASNAAVAGNAGGSPAAREMASADQLIDAATTEAGGTAALTEAMLLSLGQKCFNEGGDPSVFMISPDKAQIIAGFTGAAGRYRNFNDAQKTLTNVIDLYVKNKAYIKPCELTGTPKQVKLWAISSQAA